MESHLNQKINTKFLWYLYSFQIPNKVGFFAFPEFLTDTRE